VTPTIKGEKEQEMGLDDVLNVDAPLEVIAEETTEVETPEVEVEEVAAATETETETVETKVEEVAETTAAVEADPPDAPAYYHAMKDERQKRQQYENRVKELEAQAAAQPKPDFWDDPDKAISQVRHEMTTDFENRLLNMSESTARARHDDFQEKADVFLELSGNSPQLFAEMKNAADPAEFAYKHAEKFLAFKEMGDPSQYRGKIEAELRETITKELEAKFQSTIEAEVAKRIPAGFTESASKTSPEKEGFAGPPSLNSVLS
jgi:hypothetical protein